MNREIAVKPLGDSRKHFWLAQRMARLNGLELNEAADQGNLDQESWAGIVHRCRGCDWVEGCERFLDKGVAPEALPVGCKNRMQFSVLKALDDLENAKENP